MLGSVDSNIMLTQHTCAYVTPAGLQPGHHGYMMSIFGNVTLSSLQYILRCNRE